MPWDEKAYQLEYARRNRKQKAAYAREWRRRSYFGQKAAHYNATYKPKVRINKYDLAKLWKAQRGKCSLSGRKMKRGEASLDHIVPRSMGGSNELENLQWTIRRANNAKWTGTNEELVSLCRDIIKTIG